MSSNESKIDTEDLSKKNSNDECNKSGEKKSVMNKNDIDKKSDAKQIDNR